MHKIYQSTHTEICQVVLILIKNEVFLQSGLVCPYVRPYARTRQLGLFVNLGRLELTYRAQTFWNHFLYQLGTL